MAIFIRLKGQRSVFCHCFMFYLCLIICPFYVTDMEELSLRLNLLNGMGLEHLQDPTAPPAKTLHFANLIGKINVGLIHPWEALIDTIWCIQLLCVLIRFSHALIFGSSPQKRLTWAEIRWSAKWRSKTVAIVTSHDKEDNTLGFRVKSFSPIFLRSYKAW